MRGSWSAPCHEQNDGLAAWPDGDHITTCVIDLAPHTREASPGLGASHNLPCAGVGWRDELRALHPTVVEFAGEGIGHFDLVFHGDHPLLVHDVQREASPVAVGAVGVTDLGDLDEGTQREVANLGQVLLDQLERVGLDLRRHIGLEVLVSHELSHALQLLVSVHRQVDAERAGTHGLVERSQRVVADEDDATLEFERGGEVGTLDLGLPADDALGIAVERSLQEVDRRRILQNAVAVVKDDDPILVLEQRAVQRIGGRVALDHDVLLGGRDMHGLGLQGIHEPVGSQNLADGVGLADATLTRDDGGGGLALGHHLREGLSEGEAVGDRERKARRDLVARDLLETREMGLEQALGAVHGLGLGHDLAVGHRDILATCAVERDGGLDGLGHGGILLRGGGEGGGLGGSLDHEVSIGGFPGIVKGLFWAAARPTVPRPPLHPGNGQSRSHPGRQTGARYAWHTGR